MIPPKGFEAEVYPLWHKIKYSVGLSSFNDTFNSTYLTLIRNSNDVDLTPQLIEVNPHNANYQEEGGSCVQKMSIIKNFKLSLKFNATENAFTTDKLPAVKFLWRPVFFSFEDKLSAKDDDTGINVKTILELTSDSASSKEDVTPTFANTKFPVVGTSDLLQPLSSVNLVEVIADLNMDTAAGMEEVAWDEEQFQNAKRRFTNRGALKACVGRTRYGTLTPNKPHISYNIKGIPSTLKRIHPHSFFAILVHAFISVDIGAPYNAVALTDAVAHIGVKAICSYEEWNEDHFQKMSGTGV